MRGKEPPASGPGGGVAVDRTSAHEVKGELFRLERRLRTLVNAYEERPSAIDAALAGAAGRALDAEAAIAAAFTAMKSLVFSEASPLRSDTDLWDAFREQQDEFTAFYRCALNAVEVHKELLQHYLLLRDEAKMRPQHGDLERIRQDKRAFVEERDECIAAISYFCGKFSAMLTDLRA